MRLPHLPLALLAAALQACTSETPPEPLQQDQWRVRWLGEHAPDATGKRPYSRRFAVDHTGAATQLELVVRNARGAWGRTADDVLAEDVVHTIPLPKRDADPQTGERMQLEVYVELLEGDEQHDARLVWRQVAPDRDKAQGRAATFRIASNFVEGDVRGGPSWPLGPRTAKVGEAIGLTEWDRGSPEPAPGSRTECRLQIRLR